MSIRVAWTVCLISLVGLMGCAVNPVTQEKELSLFTEAEEVQLGRDAAPEVEKELGGKTADPALQAYVDSVGQKVGRVSHRPGLTYHYAVVNSDVPNALALPGGYIYITRGLLANIQNEAQLAAVLGHETGHVTARHGVQHLQRNLGLQILVDAVGRGTGSQNAAALSRVAANMLSLSYSRQDETQSDELGIDYAYKAGYNPWGMVELLQVLQSLEKTSPSRWTTMFRTHPLTSTRVSEAGAYIQKQYGDVQGSPSLRFNRQQFLDQTRSLRATP